MSPHVTEEANAMLVRKKGVFSYSCNGVNVSSVIM